MSNKKRTEYLHFFIVNCTDLLAAFDFWKNLVSSLRNCNKWFTQLPVYVKYVSK